MTIALVVVIIVLAGRIVPQQSSPAAAPTEMAFATATEGFEQIKPTWLPEGYTFLTSRAPTGGLTTCLYYRGIGDDEQYPSLVIAQSRAELPTVEQLRDPLYAETNIVPEDIPINREMVQVGGATGEANLIGTGMDVSQLCGGMRLPMDRVLMWQAGDLHFALFSGSDSWWGIPFLTKLEMRRVAESMTGVSTIAADTMDPERLSSTESAAAMAGFIVSEPITIPVGYQFDHAAYWQDGETRNVLLVYRTNDGLLGFNTLQTFEPTDTLETRLAANPEIYEKVVVNNQPALFSIGYCWDENSKPFFTNCGSPQSLIWFENGMEYGIMGNFSKAAIIAIAESMYSPDLTLVDATAIPQNQPLRYFTRAERDTWSVETLVPGADTGWDFNLSIAEAEQLAGFDVLEPIGMSKFLNFQGAAFDPQRNIVRIRYVMGFVLHEEQFQFSEDCDGCGMVGASAVVETVQIGDVTGEYVVGVWEAIGDTGQWGWIATPYLQRLRWQSNGMAFELMYNPTHDPAAVTLADLIAIAESLR